MGRFEEFQERSSVVALTFFVWYVLPAAAIFLIWLFWADTKKWWGPPIVFR